MIMQIYLKETLEFSGMHRSEHWISWVEAYGIVQWMPLDEFVEQPLVKDDSMFKKVISICIARLGKRYCGLSSHQVVSKFDGRLSSLYYNVVDTPDFNCSSCWSCWVTAQK